MTPPHPEDERLRRDARDREIDRLLAERRAGVDRRQDVLSPSEMPGGVWLFNELTALRTLITDQHGRVRADMAAGFAKVSDEFRAHELLDQTRDTRVTLLEDRAAQSKADAAKRTLAMSTLVAAVVGPAAAAAWKRLFGGP